MKTSCEGVVTHQFIPHYSAGYLGFSGTYLDASLGVDGMLFLKSGDISIGESSMITGGRP